MQTSDEMKSSNQHDIPIFASLLHLFIYFMYIDHSIPVHYIAVHSILILHSQKSYRRVLYQCMVNSFSVASCHKKGLECFLLMVAVQEKEL